MAATESGGIINWSGSDAVVDDLDGISGVTKLTIGSGALEYNMWKLNNRVLNVTGSPVIDENNEILFDSNAPDRSLRIASGGSLTLGDETMVNGATLRPEWTPIRFSKSAGAGASEGNADLSVDGTLTQFGGGILSAGIIAFNTNATIRLVSGYMRGTHATRSTRIRQRSTNLRIEDVYRVYGSLRFDFFQPPVTAVGFEPGYTSLGGFQAVSSVVPGGSNSKFLFENFDVKGATYAGDAYGKAKVEFKNLELRDELLVTHNASGGASLPVTKVVKEFQLDVKDVDGNVVEGARFHIGDVNNGSRYQSDASWNDGTTENFVNDRSYSDVSGSNGKTPVTTILTRALREGQSIGGVYERTNTNAYSGTTVVDYRSKNNSYDDVFDIHVWSYKHLYARLNNVEMIGRGVKVIPVVLLEDSNVDEEDDTVVAGYSTKFNVSATDIRVMQDATLDELYDYLKYLKTTVSGIVMAGVDRYIGAAIGKKLNIGGINCSVDSGVTLSRGGNFDELETVGRAAGDGTYDVDLTDDRGSVFTINVNSSIARVYVVEKRDGHDDVVHTSMVTPSGGNGQYKFNVHGSSTLEVTVKAPGLLPVIRREYVVARQLTVSINLGDDVNVDEGRLDAIEESVMNGLTLDYVNYGVATFRTSLTPSTGSVDDTVAMIDMLLSSENGIKLLAHYGTGTVDENNRLSEADVELSNFPTIVDVAFWRNKFYVLSNLNSAKLHRLDMDGTEEAVVDIPSASPGLAGSPNGIAVHRNKVYIVYLRSSGDAANVHGRVRVFDSGTLSELTDETWELTMPNGVVNKSPYGIAFTPSHILILTLSGTVVRYDYNKMLDSTMETFQLSGVGTDNNHPLSMSVSNKHIVVLNLGTSVVSVYDMDGSAAVDRDGDVITHSVVGDSGIGYGAGIAYVGGGLGLYAYRYEELLHLDDLVHGTDIGVPVRFHRKTMDIHSDYVEFDKDDGLTLEQIAKIGVACRDESGNEYFAPFRDNGRVLFSDQSEIVVLTSAEAENAAVAVAGNMSFTDRFKRLLVDEIYGIDARGYNEDHTFGKLLNMMALNTADSVWADTDLASDSSGSAGHLLRELALRLNTTVVGKIDNLDVAVSSRLPVSGYVSPPTVGEIRTELEKTGTKITDIKAKTDKLSFTSGNVNSRVKSIDNADVEIIRDSIWEIGTSSLTDDGSIGKHLAELTSGSGSGGGLTSSQASDLSAIKSKTDGLKFVGDDVKATLDSEEVDVGKVKGTAVTGIADFRGSSSGGSVDLSATNTKIDGVKSVVDDIKTETDKIQGIADGVSNIPTTPTGLTSSQAAQLSAIKNKTDDLNFVGDDVKATLDGETVTTDAASRTASKADVSGLATSSEISSLDTVVDGVKAKTDKLKFSGDDVKVTLDGEEVDVGKVKGSAVSGVGDFKADRVSIDTSSLATQSSLDAVNSSVSAIKNKTDVMRFVGDADASGTKKISADADITLGAGATVNVDLTDTNEKLDELIGNVDVKVSSRMAKKDFIVGRSGGVSSMGAFEVKANVVKVGGKTVKSVEEFKDGVNVEDIVGEIERENGVLRSVEKKIGRVRFDSNGKIVATLDGEKVSVDDESRNAMKVVGFSKVEDLKNVESNIMGLVGQRDIEVGKRMNSIDVDVGSVDRQVSEIRVLVEDIKAGVSGKSSVEDIGGVIERVERISGVVEEIQERVGKFVFESESVSGDRERVRSVGDMKVSVVGNKGDDDIKENSKMSSSEKIQKGEVEYEDDGEFVVVKDKDGSEVKRYKVGGG